MKLEYECENKKNKINTKYYRYSFLLKFVYLFIINIIYENNLDKNLINLF